MKSCPRGRRGRRRRGEAKLLRHARAKSREIVVRTRHEAAHVTRLRRSRRNEAFCAVAGARPAR
eukprot:7379703-Prymnesium_polylepis.1